MPDSVKTFETLELLHEGEIITFAVIRSVRRKSCSVVIDARGVHIAAPEALNLDSIREVLIPKLPLLLERNALYQDMLGPPKRERQFVSGESLRLVGRPYLLRVVSGKDHPVKIQGIYVVVGAAAAVGVREALEAWYSKEATSVFVERVPLWARRLGVTPGRILIRSQKRRWGSCDALGNLRLNWRLVMAPMSLIDYVIAHELTHLRSADHSPQFWTHLRAVMPDYLERKAQLAHFGSMYDW
ncbi:M48 family metallopeptidase [Deinococcus frigens]|uniref:M48 family metallopeptidase n=1 Tax=Deinococcus frigens TaxID=249403 RepID=UPI000690F20C|nr:SprT family zinc-dependent metalloprotease [Deinococcus frigens]